MLEAMSEDTCWGPPSLITIAVDKYQAKDIGWTKSGCQFFLTTPFLPQTPDHEGNEFIALYIFDRNGKLIDSKIDEFGPRGSFDSASHKQLYEQRLEELGELTREKIRVSPFVVQKFNINFGLIERPPQGDEDVWSVQAQPGNYMAFYEPWDRGRYDT